MTSDIRNSRAGFSAARLRSVVLAFAVAVQASPVRGNTLDLFCAATREGSNMNVRFQIDTERRRVVEVGERGNYEYVTTMMSEQFIKYSDPDKGKDDVHALQEGTFDRIAGTLTIYITVRGQVTGSSHWVCRRATQKF